AVHERLAPSVLSQHGPDGGRRAPGPAWRRRPSGQRADHLQPLAPVHVCRRRWARPDKRTGRIRFRRKVVRGHAETAAVSTTQIQEVDPMKRALMTLFLPFALAACGTAATNYGGGSAPSSPSGSATVSVADSS